MAYSPFQNTGSRFWPIIAHEGWPIIAVMTMVAAALAASAWWLHPWAGGGVGVVGLALVVWAIWFFRDPSRRTPTSPDAIISGADGVVCFVGPGSPPAELNVPAEVARGMTRVSVFMNVFNVHVNRSPAAGRIERIAYRPGKFFNAAFDKASEHNERLSMLLRLDRGGSMVVVQIAGLIARRIVCRASEGQAMAAGERFGLIRFGSRVDHYLPAGAETGVRIGDKSTAGETVIARLTGSAMDRETQVPEATHA
jgi:phosphatidylserine decarboxylase